jgi:hypothetical protein
LPKYRDYEFLGEKTGDAVEGDDNGKIGKINYIFRIAAMFGDC